MIANLLYNDPDGSKIIIPISDYKQLQDRIPLGFLEAAIAERSWIGIPSVTQLAVGERETWLKVNTPYTLDLETVTWAIFGTAGHKVMETSTGSEIHLRDKDDMVYGTCDFYDADSRRLWDFKFVGSYKAAKAIGIQKEQVPVTDAHGNPVRFKTGARAGEVKTTTVIKRTGSTDADDWIKQVNVYAFLLEQQGKVVEEMNIFAIVRDFGTHECTNRGVTRPFYKIGIPRIPEEYIESYVTERSNAIKEAMAKPTPPPVCSKDFCWDGRKCDSKYCAVYTNCRELLNADQP
jgi:hypothetical protein